jgi:hypothetical protein
VIDPVPKHEKRIEVFDPDHKGKICTYTIAPKDFDESIIRDPANRCLKFNEAHTKIPELKDLMKDCPFKLHVSILGNAACWYRYIEEQNVFVVVSYLKCNESESFPGRDVLKKLFPGHPALFPRSSRFPFYSTGSISGEGSQPDTVHINLDSEGTSSPMNFTSSDHRRSIFDRRYVEKSTPMSSLIPLNVRYQGKDFIIDQLNNDDSMQKVPLQDHVIAVDAKIIQDKLVVVGCKVPTDHATDNNIKVVMQGIFQPINYSALRPIEKLGGSNSRNRVSMN